MIPRRLASCVTERTRGYSAVVITGPRQAGKTVFAKQVFGELPYSNLENPTERVIALQNPIEYLERFPRGAILDEVQRVPDLLSAVQVRIDQEPPGATRWILTGSQQFDLSRHTSQSLAGRAARLELLPFSLEELSESPLRPSSLARAVLHGGYPPIYDERRSLDPIRWLDDYVSAVTERDLREFLEVRNRAAFDRVVRMVATRTGQLVNKNEIASECGVDHKTIDMWLGALEACYVIRLVRPHERNLGKRITRRPKLYFYDTGLACRLLSIGTEEQLRAHPCYGALVENWCVLEVLKGRLNRGLRPDLWFWRSSDGLEVDLVVEIGGGALIPIEIKSGDAASPKSAHAIRKLRELSARDPSTTIRPGFVIYGGTSEISSGEDRQIPWHQIDEAVVDSQ